MNSDQESTFNGQPFSPDCAAKLSLRVSRPLVPMMNLPQQVPSDMEGKHLHAERGGGVDY